MAEQMKSKIGVALAFLLLTPATAYARLGGGDYDPRFMGFLTPSPLYSVIVIPCYVGMVVLLLFLQRRASATGVSTSTVRLVVATSFQIVLGLVLFLLYPRICAALCAMFREMATGSRGFPAWTRPPLWTMLKPGGGVLLVLVWFLVQPIPLQVTAQWLTKQSQIKLRAWPLVAFFYSFTLWLMAALFRPLC